MYVCFVFLKLLRSILTSSQLNTHSPRWGIYFYMDSTTHTASKLVNNKYICKDIYVMFLYDQALLYI